MRQQPGRHIAMTDASTPEAEVRPVDLGGGGDRFVQDSAGIAVEQHVDLGWLIRLWRLSCC